MHHPSKHSETSPAVTYSKNCYVGRCRTLGLVLCTLFTTAIPTYFWFLWKQFYFIFGNCHSCKLLYTCRVTIHLLLFSVTTDYGANGNYKHLHFICVAMLLECVGPGAHKTKEHRTILCSQSHWPHLVDYPTWKLHRHLLLECQCPFDMPMLPFLASGALKLMAPGYT